TMLNGSSTCESGRGLVVVPAATGSDPIVLRTICVVMRTLNGSPDSSGNVTAGGPGSGRVIGAIGGNFEILVSRLSGTACRSTPLVEMRDDIGSVSMPSALLPLLMTRVPGFGIALVSIAEADGCIGSGSS